jgi:hypothetical protein
MPDGGEYALKAVCEERFRSVKDDIKEIKRDNKEAYKRISESVDSLKFDVVKLLTKASNGKPITVETEMKSRDKAVVTVAFITGLTSIIVTLIQVFG